MTNTDLEKMAERVQQLESTAAIHERLRAYGTAIDKQRLEEFVDCFTDDGVWYAVFMTGTDFYDQPRGVRTGRESIERAGRAMLASIDGPTRHVVVDSSVQFETPTMATAASDFFTLQAATWGAAPRITSSGRYIDRLLLDQDGSWRFAERRCEIDMSEPLPATD
jgi:hypothetical protein